MKNFEFVPALRRLLACASVCLLSQGCTELSSREAPAISFTVDAPASAVSESLATLNEAEVATVCAHRMLRDTYKAYELQREQGLEHPSEMFKLMSVSAQVWRHRLSQLPRPEATRIYELEARANENLLAGYHCVQEGYQVLKNLSQEDQDTVARNADDLILRFPKEFEKGATPSTRKA